MRAVEITVYQFEELSDDAKERAREWYKGPGFCFAWLDESINSIEVFCERFGVRLTSYSCNPHEPYSFTTDADNDCFRGLRLNQFDRDHMPTGYALDCALWQTFVDEWKRTGSARTAFTLALEAAFKEWRTDLEYQLTDESVDGNIIANEYEFTIDGSHYCPPEGGKI